MNERLPHSLSKAVFLQKNNFERYTNQKALNDSASKLLSGREYSNKAGVVRTALQDFNEMSKEQYYKLSDDAHWNIYESMKNYRNELSRVKNQNQPNAQVIIDDDLVESEDPFMRSSFDIDVDNNDLGGPSSSAMNNRSPPITRHDERYGSPGMDRRHSDNIFRQNRYKGKSPMRRHSERRSRYSPPRSRHSSRHGSRHGSPHGSNFSRSSSNYEECVDAETRRKIEIDLGKYSIFEEFAHRNKTSVTTIVNKTLKIKSLLDSDVVQNNTVQNDHLPQQESTLAGKAGRTYRTTTYFK